MSYNELTDAEAERLACLAEECAEVIQVIGKILRHGYESVNPDRAGTHRARESNRDLLNKEIGDACGIMEMMDDSGDIDSAAVTQHAMAKRKKVKHYLHHATDEVNS